ncbi:MAG: hypothetical protein ABJD97_10150 [Betaproteobacteria bacterium]
MQQVFVRRISMPRLQGQPLRRLVMSTQFRDLYRTLCIVLASHVVAGGAQAVRPSDCLARDADSTCATAVAGAPVAPPITHENQKLYSGPLGGVPTSGYAYWGFDFMSDAAGIASQFPNDMFVNRSGYPVTITLSFNIPTNHPCRNNCLPGVQFEVDAGWITVRPAYEVVGDTVSLSYQARPGQGYGWVIGLWEATNPKLTVTVAPDVRTTMDQLGLPDDPSIAQLIPAVTKTCICWDATEQACSAGSRFSNGLMGPWFRVNSYYERGGAFSNCPPER